MARKTSNTLTDAESRIMDVLWQQKEASVRDVMDGISGETNQAYNTIQTILGILKEKGFVDTRKEGRAFLYRPLISRGEARNQALKQLIGNAFGGSTAALAQHLFKDSDIHEGEISALEQVLEKAIQEKE
ncbi:BlaI/MecI/CopY family transcriptional regulator [Pseudemcibacter aquimaris]|uniref:BlaI/MecI/CopY family transcriptional regulator n=1 Tax=Pseudemcibacter aquimaris TaxID=2857064 RepID=UPI0020117C47|nr:BlaI/MecI/CopY family transcriptional regulator [Pseudemcibacter aquimaris]MCC3860350.1 BlaI/MecI/CopY family transcriptional regulator [Pseudemcibacter aquimaris]WDU57676.1 BlaI/MecI/CopY family transcriptional regulator [Pseudemcibacter aquimaris]